MDNLEAGMAIKSRALVGTSNVQGRGGFCLFATGYLKKEIKTKGKKEFLFQDRGKEIEVVRPASVFTFMR